MPRDDTAVAIAVVDLPGHRKGRVVSADDAGAFRIHVTGALTSLADEGLLDGPQCEAARYLLLLIEAAGLRDSLCSAFEPQVDSSGGSYGLERLTRGQFRAWKQLSKITRIIPPHCRSVVETTVVHDVRPSPAALPRLQLALSLVARALGLRTR
jgi:hypothetical protein